jgi:hypothetical protein
MKNTWKVPPFSSSPVVSVERPLPTNAPNLRTSRENFQVREKRGPGRPRKNKINGKIKVALEQSKNKKKSMLATAVVPTTTVKAANAFIPAFPTQNDWLRRRKKRKKKDAKEKMKISNPELVKEIENLAEFFSRKCIIEDEKLSLIDISFQHHPTITR